MDSGSIAFPEAAFAVSFALARIEIRDTTRAEQAHFHQSAENPTEIRQLLTVARRQSDVEAAAHGAENAVVADER